MRVIWIPRKHKNKTYRYPFIASSYRNKEGKARNKIHFNLHGLPEHTIKAIDDSLRHGPAPKECVAIADVEFTTAVDVGASWSVCKAMEKLGIINELQRVAPHYRTAIVSMIVDRVTNSTPYSTRALYDQFDGSGLARILDTTKKGGLDSWYEALEHIHKHQEAIQLGLFKQSPSQKKRLILYDISSSYFEGTQCPLAAYGYNRDGKKGKKQIVYGVITDDEGRPLGITVFDGNTKDETTVLEQIKALKDTYGMEDVVFVGDRGMITSHKIDILDETRYTKWLRYITAINRSDIIRMAEDQTHPIQLGLFDEKRLVEVTEKNKRYVLCHNPLKKEE